jgi:hypothetical protein
MEFIVPPIETLWIVPILGFALFIPVVILTNSRSRKENSGTDEPNLEAQVARFNSGAQIIPATVLNESRGTERLQEMEKTISLVMATLSNQQRLLQGANPQNGAAGEELNGLKEKLRELQKEYDIVISENYALRARIQSLLKQGQSLEKKSPVGKTGALNSGSAQNPKNSNGKQRVAGGTELLYDDTRTFKAWNLEDTSEYNIADL